MSMREDFLEMVRGFKAVDVATSPNFVTMRRLHEALEAKGIPHDDAYKIVGNMKISVCQEFVDDKELLDETAECYATIFANMKVEADKIDVRLFSELARSGELSLKFEV